ncbi:hypothetical protein C9374_010041 [Naegleria lovaniensis]|uniref:Uncharacterized protein n=1 Tax=Naegleria lovaniensis TaxID=51637 RepID=A0AA88KJM3_NAELO|nr:uncharacterized protein C9374_010041 [Naegleria lovaniensis]KAG2375037.1 hypothetical protein C9374_010041 [Naegleria lovaniensis]
MFSTGPVISLLVYLLMLTLLCTITNSQPIVHGYHEDELSHETVYNQSPNLKLTTSRVVTPDYTIKTHLPLSGYVDHVFLDANSSSLFVVASGFNQINQLDLSGGRSHTFPISISENSLSLRTMGFVETCVCGLYDPVQNSVFLVYSTSQNSAQHSGIPKSYIVKVNLQNPKVNSVISLGKRAQVMKCVQNTDLNLLHMVTRKENYELSLSTFDPRDSSLYEETIPMMELAQLEFNAKIGLVVVAVNASQTNYYVYSPQLELQFMTIDMNPQFYTTCLIDSMYISSEGLLPHLTTAFIKCNNQATLIQKLVIDMSKKQFTFWTSSQYPKVVRVYKLSEYHWKSFSFDYYFDDFTEMVVWNSTAGWSEQNRYVLSGNSRSTSSGKSLQMSVVIRDDEGQEFLAIPQSFVDVNLSYQVDMYNLENIMEPNNFLNKEKERGK